MIARIEGEALAKQFNMTLNHYSGDDNYAYFSDVQSSIGLEVTIEQGKPYYRFVFLGRLMIEIRSPKFSIPNSTAQKWYNRINMLRLSDGAIGWL